MFISVFIILKQLKHQPNLHVFLTETFIGKLKILDLSVSDSSEKIWTTVHDTSPVMVIYSTTPGSRFLMSPKKVRIETCLSDNTILIEFAFQIKFNLTK